MGPMIYRFDAYRELAQASERSSVYRHSTNVRRHRAGEHFKERGY